MQLREDGWLKLCCIENAGQTRHAQVMELAMMMGCAHAGTSTWECIATSVRIISTVGGEACKMVCNEEITC